MKLPWLIALLWAMTGSLSVHAAAPRSVPDFGLMLNEDSDLVLPAADPDPTIMTRNIEQALDALKQTPAKTLIFTIGCGSDILYYPTKVGSTWGWRTTSGDQKAPWDKYLPNLRAAAQANFDSVQVAADWSHKNGLKFIPTYRMNDAHFIADPQNSVLTGRFWIENGQRFRFGTSPIPEIEAYKELLDFSHPEVRAHRLAILLEAAERYAPVMDGFQLDFMRNPILFPNDTAERQAPLITQMLVEVRQRLDELGARNGRFYPLIVRMPPTLDLCRRSGLDVPQWLKQKLVNILIPSPGMTLYNDLPVDQFVNLARPAGVGVYVAMLDRTQFAWPFVAHPEPSSYSGTVDWVPDGPLCRGAVINARSMGAAGFELYNYNLPLSDNGKALAAAASEANPIQGARVYAVTPRYFLDQTVLFGPPKQLPVRLKPNKPVTLTLYVGENLQRSAAGKSLDCALRLGVWLNNQPGESLGKLMVRLNGKILHDGPVTGHYTPVTGKQTRTSKHVPPPVQGYFQIPITDLSVVRKGENQITLTAQATDPQVKYTLCEVHLGVLPTESAQPAAAQQPRAARRALDSQGNPAKAFVAIENVCAWPNLVMLPDGTITAMIFNQPSHGRMIGDVDCYASTDGGHTWQKRGTPAPHQADTLQNRMNDAAGLAANGDLLVITSGYKLYPKPNAHGPYEIDEILPPLVSRSSDGGATWTLLTDAFPKAAPDGSPLIPFGSIVKARSGLRVTAYTTRNKNPGVYVFSSADDGQTWGNPVRIQTNLPINETTLWSNQQGTLIAAARDLLKQLHIFRSTDDGQTWTHLGTASDRFGIPGNLLQLRDGRLLLSHGNRSKGTIGIEGVDARISADQGQSWSDPVRLADFMGYDGGYPSSVQLADGTVVTAFYAHQTPQHDGYQMAVVIWDPVRTFKQ